MITKHAFLQVRMPLRLLNTFSQNHILFNRRHVSFIFKLFFFAKLKFTIDTYLLLILHHPQHDLLLLIIAFPLRVNFLKFISSFTPFLLFTTYFNIKKVLKSLEV